MNRHLRRLVAAPALALLALASHATNLLDLSYDADRDELVIEAAYRGSSPDHAYSLVWGECREDTFSNAAYLVTAQLLDAQAQESGNQEFRQTLRFPLGPLKCRPANVTVISSARFHRTILVPAVATPEP